MLVEKEIKDIFEKLIQENTVHLQLSSFDVTLRIFDNSLKLSLATPVYQGESYIPKSIKKCITTHPPFALNHIKTYLTIEEKTYQVFLHYLGPLHNLSQVEFKELVEEFIWLASEWRAYLDERGKQDLIHVRVH